MKFLHIHDNLLKIVADTFSKDQAISPSHYLLCQVKNQYGNKKMHLVKVKKSLDTSFYEITHLINLKDLDILIRLGNISYDT